MSVFASHRTVETCHIRRFDEDHKRVQTFFPDHAQDKYTIIIILDIGKESGICRYVIKFTSNLKIW